MKVSIKDLKNLCEKILTKAEQSGLNEIDVDIDYYWDVDYENRYDFESKKQELSVGSFIDDWENLQRVLENKIPPTTLDLERLGDTIKIIGDSIHKSKKLIFLRIKQQDN